MEKILTIVVPTYNMEDYLDACLSSMIMDDLLLMNALEVIVVNDGSKDRSLEIAMSYKERYPNTYVVIDKENGNYGSCVNRGLKEANGKYFRIVDADDWLDTDVLKRFIVKLRECDCDLVFTNYALVRGSQIEYSKRSHRILSDVVYNLDNIVYQKYDLHMQMHGMTYKTKVLIDCGLSLSEGVSYTDTEYCFFPIPFTNTLVFYNLCLYKYRAEREGQTMSDESRIRSTYSMHKVSLNLVHNFMDYDGTARSKMRLEVIERMLGLYYWTILGMCHKGTEINTRLKELHNIVTKTPILITSIRSFKERKIRYVLVWERTGLYTTNILFAAYNLIYDYLGMFVRKLKTIIN